VCTERVIIFHNYNNITQIEGVPDINYFYNYILYPDFSDNLNYRGIKCQEATEIIKMKTTPSSAGIAAGLLLLPYQVH
jgi:hypothetical protein